MPHCPHGTADHAERYRRESPTCRSSGDLRELTNVYPRRSEEWPQHWRELAAFYEYVDAAVFFLATNRGDGDPRTQSHERVAPF